MSGELAPLVDDVQLLFFESAAKSRSAPTLDVQALRDLAEEHGLSYTVHLPTDLALGAASRAERQEGIGEILRLMAQLAPLAPLSFDLHLVREPDLPEAAWLDNLAASLEELSVALGAREKAGWGRKYRVSIRAGGPSGCGVRLRRLP